MQIAFQYIINILQRSDNFDDCGSFGRRVRSEVLGELLERLEEGLGLEEIDLEGLDVPKSK